MQLRPGVKAYVDGQLSGGIISVDAERAADLVARGLAAYAAAPEIAVQKLTYVLPMTDEGYEDLRPLREQVARDAEEILKAAEPLMDKALRPAEDKALAPETRKRRGGKR